MNARERRHAEGARRARGTSMLTTIFALSALLAAGAFAMDTGAIWLARTQMQSAVDAAALAAAQEMIDFDFDTVDKNAARTAAADLGMANSALGANGIVIDTTKMEFGQWQFPDAANGQTRGTLDTSVDQTDPDKITGVRVEARLGQGGPNPAMPALLGHVLGRDSYEVTAQATGFLGFEGGAGPGQIVIPIAIDCCKMGAGACDDGYCASDNPPTPNACDLETPQDEGENTVSCIVTHNTDEQIGCWTELSTTDKSTNTADIKDVINGDGEPVTTQDKIYVTNGTNAAVLGQFERKFLEEGTDRYEPMDGVDSWVRALPVIECQAHEQKAGHCAGSTPKQVVGFVCFEMREVEKVPDKVVRGRFLCPNNDFDRDLIETECDLGDDPGGLNFGLRVTKAVLVD